MRRYWLWPYLDPDCHRAGVPLPYLDSDCKGEEGWGPVATAAAMDGGRVDVVVHLLRLLITIGAAVDERDFKRMTALHVAVRLGEQTQKQGQGQVMQQGQGQGQGQRQGGVMQQ